jgi:hypothetical protein
MDYATALIAAVEKLILSTAGAPARCPTDSHPFAVQAKTPGWNKESRKTEGRI